VVIVTGQRADENHDKHRPVRPYSRLRRTGCPRSRTA